MRSFAICCIAFGLSLSCLACSSSEPEVNEPSSSSSGTAEETPPQNDPASHLPEPPEPMVQQILGQKVLDHRHVSLYLHTEIAANMPLKVHAVSGLDEGVSRLKAGGQPVQVTPTAEEARFRFVARERVGGSKARIRFEIPDEGVVGHVDFELRDNLWNVVDAHVVEQ